MARDVRRGTANPVKDKRAGKQRTKELTDQARPRGDRGAGTHPGERGGLAAGGGTDELSSMGAAIPSQRPARRGDVSASGVESLDDWPANARKAVRSLVRGASGQVGRSPGHTRTGGRGKTRRKARSGKRERGR